jgi:hypothetical protein
MGNMIQAILALVNTTVLAVQAAGAAPTPPPSAALQLNEAVALVTQLEADPISTTASASAARVSLKVWLESNPQLAPRVCESIVGPLMRQGTEPWVNGGTARALVAQNWFVGGVFLAEHAKDGRNEEAAQAAGAHGMLRAYEAILRKDPTLRIPFADDLLAKRNAGTLDSWVRGQLGRCK